MNCIIKVILNPGQPRRYILNRVDTTLFVRIHVQQIPYDLDYIADQIASEFIAQKRYNVVFNFKSAPDLVKSHHSFKEKIVKIFQKTPSTSPEADIETGVTIIKAHMHHGKHPKLAEYENVKTFKKIYNYVKSVTNTSFSKQQVVDICKRIISDTL